MLQKKKSATNSSLYIYNYKNKKNRDTKTKELKYILIAIQTKHNISNYQFIL